MTKTTTRQRRIDKEIYGINIDAPAGFSLGPIDSTNLFKWQACIAGPDESPYEKAIFFLDIDFPENYPFEPPKVKFNTKILHMNVNDHGAICLAILRDHWTPALTATKVIVTILSMLEDPCTTDALVPDLALVYQEDRSRYDAIIREFVEINNLKE
jgi:ubiquitin-conjugating enzyme E2 D/E